MIISDVYKKFGIPPNLQEHMFRVWGIISFLEKHWKEPNQVNWDLIKKAALLHDLGNVVKFDLDKHPEFLGSEKSNADYWKGVQKKVVEEYGSDDHIATEKMLQEIKISSDIITVIQNKSFGNSIETSNSENWPLKILYYADLRTLPFGIGTLEEKIKDVRERMPKYTSRPDFDDLVEACRRIEKQIQDNLSVSVLEIKDQAIEKPSELEEFDI